MEYQIWEILLQSMDLAYRPQLQHQRESFEETFFETLEEFTSKQQKESSLENYPLIFLFPIYFPLFGKADLQVYTENPGAKNTTPAQEEDVNTGPQLQNRTMPFREFVGQDGRVGEIFDMPSVPPLQKETNQKDLIFMKESLLPQQENTFLAFNEALEGRKNFKDFQIFTEGASQDKFKNTELKAQVEGGKETNIDYNKEGKKPELQLTEAYTSHVKPQLERIQHTERVEKPQPLSTYETRHLNLRIEEGSIRFTILGDRLRLSINLNEDFYGHPTPLDVQRLLQSLQSLGLNLEVLRFNGNNLYSSDHRQGSRREGKEKLHHSPIPNLAEDIKGDFSLYL